MDTTVRNRCDTRECGDCAHKSVAVHEAPCSLCFSFGDKPSWEPVVFQGLETAYDKPRKSPEVQIELDLGTPSLSAPGILQDAADILKERGQSRDKGDSERSMATVVNIFNAAEGLNLTEEQGWKFMLCLKLGRMKGGKFHFDDYQDLVGYSALMAECAANTQLITNTKANG